MCSSVCLLVFLRCRGSGGWKRATGGTEEEEEESKLFLSCRDGNAGCRRRSRGRSRLLHPPQLRRRAQDPGRGHRGPEAVVDVAYRDARARRDEGREQRSDPAERRAVAVIFFIFCLDFSLFGFKLRVAAAETRGGKKEKKRERERERERKNITHPTEVGTAMTGASTSPATTAGRAPSVPETTTTTSAARTAGKLCKTR